MRAFVTGGTGLLGNNLIRTLESSGHTVRALVRSPQKGKRLLGNTGAELIEGDLGNIPSWAEALDGCDLLFHGAAYISRMSDYCRSCFYDPKNRFGPAACPFNSLYRHFCHRHRTRLEGNPRIGFVYRTLDRMASEDRRRILAQAERYLNQIEEL